MKETSAFRDERHRLGIFANGIRLRCCNFHKRFQFVERDELLEPLFEGDLLKRWLEPLFVEVLVPWFAEQAEGWVGSVFAQVEPEVHALERGMVHSYSLQLLL